MNETKTSFAAAGGVIAAIGLVVTGAVVRDRVDIGASKNSPAGTLAVSQMLASRGSEVPEGDYFYELTKLLKREYVEKVTDEGKLAEGAVRGMIASLGDPNSLYMDKDEYRAYLASLKGEYEGIGAELVLELPPSSGKAVISRPGRDEGAPDPVTDGSSKIPKLVVAAVVPGGPADKAGVKPGDWVQSVDGRWVIDPETVNRYREILRRAMNDTKPDQKATLELRDMRRELRPKLENSLLPLRARDKLVKGASGTVKVVWHRGNDLRGTNIPKGRSAFPDFAVEGEKIRVPFEAGSAAALKAAIEGKESVVIDLRNNVQGDYDEMWACLKVVAPSGQYGILAGAKADRNRPLKIEDGNSNPPKITILADGSTRGPAEIFALALASKGLAKISGGGMDPATFVIEHGALPTGAGFTLVTGEYKAPVKVEGAFREATK
jgi:carboxyl-terminal processing protease